MKWNKKKINKSSRLFLIQRWCTRGMSECVCTRCCGRGMVKCLERSVAESWYCKIALLQSTTVASLSLFLHTLAQSIANPSHSVHLAISFIHSRAFSFARSLFLSTHNIVFFSSSLKLSCLSVQSIVAVLNDVNVYECVIGCVCVRAISYYFSHFFSLFLWFLFIVFAPTTAAEAAQSIFSFHGTLRISLPRLISRPINTLFSLPPHSFLYQCVRVLCVLFHSSHVCSSVLCSKYAPRTTIVWSIHNRASAHSKTTTTTTTIVRLFFSWVSVFFNADVDVSVCLSLCVLRTPQQYTAQSVQSSLRQSLLFKGNFFRRSLLGFERFFFFVDFCPCHCIPDDCTRVCVWTSICLAYR